MVDQPIIVEMDPVDDNEHELFLPKDQLKAAALKSGSKVALIAPSSRPESPLALKRCVQIVEDMGFNPVVGNSVLRNDGFCAGTDEERLEDLYKFLRDPSVGAIVCVSGGYGALRLLPLFDFGEIRKNPKIFLGSGDNDALLLAINELTGLVVFHGSNLEDVGDKHSFNSIKSALSGKSHEYPINCRDEDDFSYDAVAYSLSDQVCEGVLCGGNLTVLSSLFGTRYQPKLEKKILFLDDFSERNSILDRWFTTLYLSGTLNEIAGIALGGFPGCGPRGADNMLSIEDTFGDRLKELRTAACFGFKFGLTSNDNVVPIGVKVKLDCGAGKIEFLETALD